MDEKEIDETVNPGKWHSCGTTSEVLDFTIKYGKSVRKDLPYISKKPIDSTLTLSFN